ncbi:MAG: hypothetical protein A2Z21_06850 [Candidatus Fraserbacteria bacterium RBG_16_55_9]|uniref:DinB-like domain-containing protein n=1 Tax=Fraserbacteria sp. (strain RBG_16_55_9) TaxID=1817864 RepID=A0A1F5UTW3_FRAXR|nr:MAG: hypothetical protein A2Z21_06850 [Candidatus Fraserbacteria bacterium RBG_16_55_9]
MINEAVRKYILQGTAASPTVLAYLLKNAPKQVYDRRPDPERFTIREVVAHLADWESVWMERLSKVRDEDRPTLPDRDPDQMAKEHGYEHADVGASLRRFQEGRREVLKLLENLEPSEWSRIGHHTTRGTLSIHDLAVIMLGHDNYHLVQVTEWIELP